VAAAFGNLAAAAIGTAGVSEQQVEQRRIAEASERRAAFLAEAGAVLASSLDYEATLASVAQLAVPTFADWASVDLLDHSGSLRRVAVAHFDPGKVPFAYQFAERYPPREEDPGPVALRTRQSVLIEDIPDELLEASARDEEHLRMLRELAPKSVIVAPMVLGSRLLGLISFVSAESGRKYSSPDLRTAEELARRAATAIEHARLYREARDSEARLQLTLESSELGTFDFDPATQSLTCDTRCRSIFGIPAGEGPIESSLITERIHPDDRQHVLAAVARALDPQGAGEFDVEYRAIPSPDVVRWVIARGRTFFDEAEGQRRPTRFMGTILDISSRKRAEQERIELLHREREARSIAEQLNRVGPVLAAELDRVRLMQTVTDIATNLTGAQFGALFMNEDGDNGEPFALYALSGAPRELFGDLPSLRHTPIFEPTFYQKRLVRLDDVMGDPRYGRNAPHRGVPTGHLPVRSYLAAPVISRSGRVLGALLFGHGEPARFTETHEHMAAGIAAQAAIALDNARLFAEIEAAKQALQRSNEELRRANEDLNQFAYSASHDLQEPLRMVALYSQILQREYGGKLGEDADLYLGYTVAGARRMEMLVRDLLAYTRAVSSADPVQVPVNTGDALREALTNLRNAIAESGATVHHPSLPDVLVSRVHLIQLFQNLIGNAIKYRSEASPVVEITAERDDPLVRVSIQDNGIGIEPQYAEQVFGIFKRLHTSEEYSGTGIGLAICQKIVERYGGRIWVESEGGSKGATFHFTLPAAPAAG
jgi:PAS domain S-box-containing protein